MFESTILGRPGIGIKAHLHFPKFAVDNAIF